MSDEQQKRKLSESCDAEDTLHERLKKVDPERARQLHPNDIRKISRSLQIYSNVGKKHSELLQKQKEEPGSSSKSKLTCSNSIYAPFPFLTSVEL